MHNGDRVERVDTNVAALPLTPEDFYLLSRIEGQPTVGEVIKGSGLPAGDARAKLERLIELGAVRRKGVKLDLGAAKKREPRGARTSRLARRLSSTLHAGSEPRLPTRAPSREETLDASEPPPIDSQSAEPADIEFDLVPEDDPRINPELPIDVERQRDVLSALDRLSTMNHFEVLRIMPTSNTSAIKRAYHKLSRHLHPDAYYGKDIGPFADWLRQVFDSVKTSYDLLMSSDKRDEYVQRLLEIERAKRAEVRAKAVAERQAKAEREEEEQRMREMEEALERERVEAEARRRREEEREQWRREREGRKDRDRARKMRVGTRLLGGDARKQKAETHARRAREELAAGNEGAAAGLLRLAMDLDPGNESYHRLWQEQLASAQASRSSSARGKGDRLAAEGDLASAAHYYESAARVDPTPMNLALAAKSLAAAKRLDAAHKRAMATVDALRAAEMLDEGHPPKEEADIRCELAEAFLLLGQQATAKMQAERALERSPGHKRAQKLLKRAKVT